VGFFGDFVVALHHFNFMIHGLFITALSFSPNMFALTTLAFWAPVSTSAFSLLPSPFPDQMAVFIQLLSGQMTKSSNMLLVCYFLCYRLSP
jgi:hypothetical protein